MADPRIAELERQLAEARRRTDEETRRADEETRRADEEKQLRLFEAQKAADAKAFAENLRRELAALKHEVTGRQTLRAYLRQIGRLQQHLSRLVPLLAEPPRAVTRTSQTGSSPKTTTGGLTSIHGKYYPLRLRPWSDFPRAQRAAFAALQEQLGNSDVFPSRRDVQALEGTLQGTLPTRFLNTLAFQNHARTSAYLDLAVEKPSSRVLAEYFGASGEGAAVFFDNLNAGVKSVSRTLIASDDGADSTAAPSESGSESSGSSAPKGPQKTRPDCVVLVREAWTDRSAPDPEPRRLLVGEHKPCHALRAADLQTQPLLPEDCLVRMAIATQRRKDKKASASPARAVDGEARSAARLSPTTAATATATATTPGKQTVFASALAQTYHYMMLSGLEYGYLSTGETLTCLRIPLDEPTTLLYHVSLFPAVDPKDLPQADGVPLYPSNVTASAAVDADPLPDDDALAALAVAQLCSLCLIAVPSPVRTPSWVADALHHVAPFPQLPPSHRRAASPSPLGLRRRDDSDDGGNDDDDDDDEAGGRRGRRGRFRLPNLRGGEVRAPSPLWQAHHISRGSRSTASDVETAPYCTQKCLLGLVRGLPLDAACPNYARHRDAGAVTGAEAGSSGAREGGDVAGHSITLAELGRLVRAQIDVDPENNCKLLDKEGLMGAIGRLLKISVNGLGYTFVGKAVERAHAYRLRRESRIYARLYRLQGTLIPVHLGLIKLVVPYPFMARFSTLSHLMLMSYVGETLHHGRSLEVLSEELGRDLAHDMDETYQTLYEWGVEDVDTDVYNATWCAETQRVVKIDFDHCHLDREVYAARAAAEAEAETAAAAAAEEADTEADAEAEAGAEAGAEADRARAEGAHRGGKRRKRSVNGCAAGASASPERDGKRVKAEGEAAWEHI